MKKYNFFNLVSVFALVLCLFISTPFISSAADQVDYWEQLGMSYEEYIDELDEDGVHTFYPPTTYEASDPYVIEENIKLGNGGVGFISHGDTAVNRVLPFGEALAIGNNVRHIYLTLNNNNSPLFEKGGVFNLELYVYSTAVRMTVIRTDGSSVINVIDSGNSEIHYLPISINNDNADLKYIEIDYYGPVPQSSGGVIMSAGIMRYGYILNPVPEENHTKNIFELLTEWTGNFFGNMIDSIKSALPDVGSEETSELGNSLSEYESVESDVLDPALNSMESFDFESNSIDSLGTGFVAAITFISSFLQTLYDLTPFSVVFALIATLGLASICTGLSRLWFGKGR